ncbi:peptidoglycan DD-metalloendopeptidase family protein [Devosia sp. Leaf64]|uniref:murein hydrolase activator EnvC family protein n=1 Tax=Devosia sp. Leaf64 TaxID=1736229 RepID=UPI0007881461|nr:peptidoglycan DD-metalloendopeptidase family protein [Devosia sp. Leaf64]
MPVRPEILVKAVVGGILLTAGLAIPLLAQTAVPAPSTTQPATPPTATTPVPATTDAVPETTPAPTSEAPAATPSAADPAAPAEPDTATSSAADLAEVEATLQLSRERIDELKAEIAEMEGDRTKQNAALIAAGQRVKLAEIEVTDVEDRLSNLIVEELEVRGRLDGADAEIANVLAALERISLNPPPALVVDPSDALGSARGAMLIAAIVPQLRERAETVSADLKQLMTIKEQALAEEQTLKANYAVLEEEQLRIATLIAARKQGIQQVGAQLDTEEAAALELAERASTLRELIDALSARANQATTPTTTTSPDMPQLSPEAIQVAFANAARTEPAVPFPMARGYLTQPANGVTVVQFGAGDGFGGIAQGQSVVTRAEAQVVSPADGWVLYKGPYLNYGQIIILNTGQGYTALLAGLDSISVDIGQFVLMGEPLGQMGSRTIGRTVTTNAGNAQPTLYIELRQNNQPIDPETWWAQSEQTG